jgi:hypothetical protein
MNISFMVLYVSEEKISKRRINHLILDNPVKIEGPWLKMNERK